jgi:hypothetical protein
MIKLFLLVWIGLGGRVAYFICKGLIDIAYVIYKGLIDIKKTVVATFHDRASCIIGQQHFLRGVADGLRGRQRPSEFVINNVLLIPKKETPSKKPSPSKPSIAANTGIRIRIKQWIGV